MSNILSIHIPFVFLIYSYLKILTMKSKVKVMGVISDPGRIVSPASNSFTSFWFHINQITHSWDAAFSNVMSHIEFGYSDAALVL